MAGADAVLASPATRRTASCRALGRLPSSARGDVTFSLGEPCGEEEEYRLSLDACSLCRRPLGASSDVFMYRGDAPFCSEECRREQIELDEARKIRETSYRRRRHQHHRPASGKQLAPATSPQDQHVRAPNAISAS